MNLRRQVAVALRYEAEGMPAPRIVAKGWGHLAERIREMAARSGVPIREDGDLAGLLAELDLGDFIPERLYGAVVEVMAWVYRINRL